MKLSSPFETGKTTTLEKAVCIFKANNHLHNLLLEFAERLF